MRSQRNQHEPNRGGEHAGARASSPPSPAGLDRFGSPRPASVALLVRFVISGS